MAYFLAKTDPETYSIDDLKRDKKTEWDGVRNPTAVNFIKTMKPGDTVIIYHSQGQAAVVGLAEVVSEARPDKNEHIISVRTGERVIAGAASKPVIAGTTIEAVIATETSDHIVAGATE